MPISGTSHQGDWRHFAFVPEPVTDASPDLTADAYRAVARARAALAALDATAARLPNPRLFRQTALRIEAQATAALEGTYEPLARVIAEEPHEDQDPSLREVLNFVTVAERAYEWNEAGRPWSIPGLAELHRLLLAGTRSERAYHGIRRVQVVIGRRDDAPPTAHPIEAARFVPHPPGDDLTARVRDLLDWMQTDHSATIDPVVAAAIGHYTFEALHPFHDGNGRIGRLFIVLQLHLAGVLTEPTITVSPWFETRRQLYYDALLGVSTTGDWSAWVTLFAEGLAVSADRARTSMLALTEVQSQLKEQLQRSSLRAANARLLIDLAVARPTFTVNQAAEALGIKYAGAKRLIDKMVALEILAEYGERNYNRRFHAPQVLDVLFRGSLR
ncbi:Fic family protein [Metallococcus carri]|uniref:Fic family protein n=1 Tax=Metallococcus carri TaxID=1656884 RepID=UPI002E2A2967|nr:Fic family protein [Metallococcus carri]